MLSLYSLSRTTRLSVTVRIVSLTRDVRDTRDGPSGEGLVDSPLCASFSLQGVAWSILECARRTSTASSCAFREQEDGQAAPFPPS